MKKFIALLLTLSMCLAFCACGSSQSEEPQEETTAVAETTPEDMVNGTNPLTEVSKEDFAKSVKVDLNAPEDATDVQYFIYTLDGHQDLLGEMRFKLGDKEYYERAMIDSRTQLKDFSEDDITSLTGLHYDWENTKDTTVGGLEARVYSCEGQDPAAVVVWQDGVAGCFYCLGCTDGQTSADDLVKLANDIYEPLQGDD